jgi:hypothetical protein
MDETAVRTIDSWVKRIRDQASGGQMSGRTLQSLDQSARKAATGGGDRQMVATEFREALHDNFGKTAPASVKESWDQARKQWATLKTLEPLVARNPEGGIPMQQLQGAINSSQRGRTARARGRDGELGDLATIGQRMKGPSSSGTAENLQAAGIGAGSIANLPLTLLALMGGAAAGRVANSSGLAALLMREGRGQGRQLVAPYLQPAAAAAIPLVTPKSEKAKDARKRP